MLKYALIYLERMQFNVLPLRGKLPTIKWEVWQKQIQTKSDVESMNWSNATGVGAVMGINDLRCLDIDKVEDENILESILTDLGLPSDYRWVVQSGSGEGFHIYFRCTEGDPSHSFPIGAGRMLNQKAVYKFYLKQDGICDHIELRWKDCQTALPPSMHESGGRYSFFNYEPTELPSLIDIEVVLGFINKHCQISKQTPVQKETTGTLHYDNERLESALDFLSTKLPEGSYDDWVTIGFGLASLGKTGEDYFVKMSLDNPNYKDDEAEVRAKFAKLLEDYDGKTSIRSVFRIAENYGWQKPVIKFWFLDDRDNVKISRTRFKRFLESEGLCKLKKDSSYLFVRTINNVVEEIEPVSVKDLVLDYLYRLPAEEFEDIGRAAVIDALIKGTSQFFANQFFEFLITRGLDFKRDTSKESFLFFQNGYVIVTSDNVQLVDYKDMDGYTWKKQIIDRPYRPTRQRSDVEDFLHNICRKNSERNLALKSGIGYLCHTYKDPNNAKAVAFIDEPISDGSYGRSGKGLVIKAISKIRTVVVADGRNFDLGKSFAFQRVNADTNIVAIEDMRAKFPFDRLFSIITEGLTIEKKQRDEIFLPFAESPKIVISSNYSIKGVDDSTLDRQFIIEFSDHYNKRNRPIDEFGKLFFESWTEDEWLAFYNLMIECIQLYLREGLLPYSYVNLEQKQLIDETCQEFAEFSETFILNNPYDKKKLYQDFKEEYPDYEKLTQGKFTRWLKIWARVKDVEVREMKSGSVRQIVFKGMKVAA